MGCGTVLRQGATLQLAEKVAVGQVLKGHDFSRAVKPFIFDVSRGL
jgi:hypothetical protein